MVEDRSQFALVGSCLEDRRVGSNIVFTYYCFQGVDGANWTELRTFMIAGQRDFLNALAVLDCLRLVQLQKDSLSALELNVLDVPPAQQANRVNVLVGFRDKGRRSQHGEEVREGKDFVDVECLEVDGQKGWLYACVQEIEKYLGGDGKATPGGSLSLSAKTLNDPVEGSELSWRGTVHAQVGVILPDGGYIVCETICRGYPSINHQASCVKG